MAIGDALAKNTTYEDVIDLVKMRVNLDGNPKITDTLLLKEIYLSNSKWLKVLQNNYVPGYPMTTTTLLNAITGTANPYSLDLSSVTPFIDRIVRVVHIASTTRTRARLVTHIEAEDDQQFTGTNATSLWCVNEGDALKFYKGSSFTITIASDDVEVSYFRQAKKFTDRDSKIDLLDSDAWLLATDVTITMKTYQGIDATRDQKQLDDYLNSIKQVQ